MIWHSCVKSRTDQHYEKAFWSVSDNVWI